jgi:sugar lactone lactonase YvrE
MAFFGHQLLKASVPHAPSNTWAATGSMAMGRACAASTLMYDGRVLVTGGVGATGAPTRQAEEYNPDGGAFLTASPLETPRANHSSTLLPDGRVLVAGGVDTGGLTLASAELYDPATNTRCPQSAGALFIADFGNNRARRVDRTTGIITTVAGDGNSGLSGDDGPATAANVWGPSGIAIDGNALLITEESGQRVRRVDLTTGVITTIVGTGAAGFSGDGGLAASAAVQNPEGVAVGSGGLFVADASNDRVRRVDKSVQATLTVTGAPASAAYGTSFTVSVSGGSGTGAVSFSASGACSNTAGGGLIAMTSGTGTCDVTATKSADANYQETTSAAASVNADKAAQAPLTVTGAPGSAAYATSFTVGATGGSGTGALSFSASSACSNTGGGALMTMVTGTGTCSVTAIKAADTNYNEATSAAVSVTAIKTTPAVTWAPPAAITYGTALDGTQLNAGAIIGGTIVPGSYAYTPPTGTRLQAGANQVLSVQFTPTDTSRYNAASGVVQITVNPAPLQVKADDQQKLVGDPNPPLTYTATGFLPGETTAVLTGVPALSTTASATSLAGVYAITISQGTLGAANYTSSFVNGTLTVFGPGIITTVAGNGIAAFSGDGGPGTSASLNYPSDVALDTAGNLFIADPNNNRVRWLDHTTGVITTVAGNGTAGFSGDGGLATTASLSGPSGVVVDAAGNLFIADANNNRIRRVDKTTGTITTIAGNGSTGFSGDGGAAVNATFYLPARLTLDGAGHLFMSDLSNHRVRRVDLTTGLITTVAGNGSAAFSGDGGAATSASLNQPEGLAVDGTGNVFIADLSNHRVRRVDATTGVITTVAGNGASGSSGDGGPATSASLYYPTGVAVDGGGSLFVSLEFGQNVRRVDKTTGIITTVAGNGGVGFSGDGGPATSATLYYPAAVAVDASGTFYTADQYDQRVRRVGAGNRAPTADAGPTRSSRLRARREPRSASMAPRRPIPTATRSRSSGEIRRTRSCRPPCHPP